MIAPCAGRRLRHCRSAVKIEPILRSMRLPTPFDHVSRPHGSDAETGDRQDHRPNANVRLRALTKVSAVRASKYRWTDVPLGADALKHWVQIVPQVGHSLK